VPQIHTVLTLFFIGQQIQEKNLAVWTIRKAATRVPRSEDEKEISEVSVEI
jgi:hypothetical protein